MALQPAVCTNCGSTVKVDAASKTGICEHCGTEYITEKVINKYVNQTTHVDQRTIVKHIHGKEKVDAEDRLKNADVYISLEDWGSAERQLKLAEEDYPGNPYVWLGWIRCNTKNFTDVSVAAYKDYLKLMKKAQKVGTAEQFNEIRGICAGYEQSVAAILPNTIKLINKGLKILEKRGYSPWAKGGLGAASPSAAVSQNNYKEDYEEDEEDNEDDFDDEGNLVAASAEIKKVDESNSSEVIYQNISSQFKQLSEYGFVWEVSFWEALLRFNTINWTDTSDAAFELFNSGYESAEKNVRANEGFEKLSKTCIVYIDKVTGLRAKRKIQQELSEKQRKKTAKKEKRRQAFKSTFMMVTSIALLIALLGVGFWYFFVPRYDFKLNEDGQSYAVLRPVNLKNSKEVTLPGTYKGKPVTTLLCRQTNEDMAMFQGVFYNFVKVEKVIMPASISLMYYDTFENCNKLKYIYIENTEVINIIQADNKTAATTAKSMKGFDDCDALEAIYVPNEETRAAYQAHYWWKQYSAKIIVGTPDAA